jgi:acetylornithine deacetylase
VSVITREKALPILTDLVAMPTVNPMGRPWTAPEPVERPVTEYIEALFRPYGVDMAREAVSATHENLRISLPGQKAAPATLLESHMDVVPADDWLDRAFVPRVEGDMVYGRGSCDDKGPLTAMILAVLDILEGGTEPPCPVVFLAAGDEEYAQTGIKYYRQNNPPIGRGVFGEPTNLAPIVQHKGTVRWDITVHGKSAHTSRPELGVNAILGMVEVIQALQQYQDDVQRRFVSPMLTGPTITVSKIQGGRTRNAVPDECTISVDYRLLPGMQPAQAREEAMRYLDTLALSLTHHTPQLETPPLQTALEDPFCTSTLDICRKYGGAQIELAGAPYGTDASWVSDLVPALVLGPGSIVSAHAIDEQVDINEVVLCAKIYRDILLTDYTATT